MSPKQAESLLTAIQLMPKKEQDVFLTQFADDRSFREDAIDVIIAFKRSREKGGKPFRTILTNIKESSSHS